MLCLKEYLSSCIGITVPEFEKDGLIANYAILDDFPSLSTSSFSTIYILSIRINDYKGNRVINIRHIVEDKTVFPIKDYIWGGQVRLTSEPVYETVKSICNLLNEISDTLVNMYVDYDNQSKSKSTSQNSFDDTKFMTLFNPSPTLRLTNDKKKQINEVNKEPVCKNPVGDGANLVTSAPGVKFLLGYNFSKSSIVLLILGNIKFAKSIVVINFPFFFSCI